jgi:hypothetical protein
MTRVLSRVPISDWVLRTAQAMGAAGAADKKAWRKHWADSYGALGGRTTSGSKGCPRSAAYAMWYLGWLKGCARPLLDWPADRIHERFGKNAAYAVIAARLLAGSRAQQHHSALWRRVQQEFRRETGQLPANSDQGAVKVALLLFLEGMLVVPCAAAGARDQKTPRPQGGPHGHDR